MLRVFFNRLRPFCPAGGRRARQAMNGTSSGPSSFTPETVVIVVADHTVVGRVPQVSPFSRTLGAGQPRSRRHSFFPGEPRRAGALPQGQS